MERLCFMDTSCPLKLLVRACPVNTSCPLKLIVRSFVTVAVWSILCSDTADFRIHFPDRFPTIVGESTCPISITRRVIWLLGIYPPCNIDEKWAFTMAGKRARKDGRCVGHVWSHQVNISHAQLVYLSRPKEGGGSSTACFVMVRFPSHKLLRPPPLKLSTGLR